MIKKTSRMNSEIQLYFKENPEQLSNPPFKLLNPYE